jgi:hypothetical protein
MSNKIRKALLVNPWAQTVTEVQHDHSDYRNIYKALTHPEGYEVEIMEGICREESGDYWLADEEAKLHGDLSRQKFWTICYDGGVAGLIGGMALIVGREIYSDNADEDDVADVELTAEQALARIIWTDEGRQERLRKFAQREIEAGPIVVGW